MMDKRLTVIYADAAEKFVKNVVLYGNEGVLYYDEACTEVVNGAELENLFLKGLVVKYGGDYYTAHVCGPNGNNGVSVTIFEADASPIQFNNSIVNEEEAEEAE